VIWKTQAREGHGLRWAAATQENINKFKYSWRQGKKIIGKIVSLWII
jgi:hypothetical protein